MEIAGGYEPLSTLEFTLMASRRALVREGFPESEIAKMETGLRARKQMFKAIRRRFHPGLIDRLFKQKEIELQPLACDICKRPACDMDRCPSSSHPVPPGIVLDYGKCKSYVVCGACQTKLGLEATEPGLLIHEVRDEHGYVDLDRIENPTAG